MVGGGGGYDFNEYIFNYFLKVLHQSKLNACEPIQYVWSERTQIFFQVNSFRLIIDWWPRLWYFKNKAHFLHLPTV